MPVQQACLILLPLTEEEGECAECLQGKFLILVPTWITSYLGQFLSWAALLKLSIPCPATAAV